MTSILDNEKQTSFEIEPSLKLRLSGDSLNNSLTEEHIIKDETFKSSLKTNNKKNDNSFENLSSKSRQEEEIEKEKRNVNVEEVKSDLKEIKSDINLKEINNVAKKEGITFNLSSKDEEENLLNEKEKDAYLKLLLLEEELDEELSKLRTELDSVPSKQTTMNYLHEYNNIKDAAQVVLGALATMREVTIASLHKEYNLPTADE